MSPWLPSTFKFQLNPFGRHSPANPHTALLTEPGNLGIPRIPKYLAAAWHAVAKGEKHSTRKDGKVGMKRASAPAVKCHPKKDDSANFVG